jgi:non-heme chloroperoxidase
VPRLSVGSDNGQPVELHYQDVGAGRPDRPAFLDGFTAEFSNVGGKGLLDRTSGAVSEQQRQYALRIVGFASPKGTLDCITAFGRTDFRGDVAKVTVPTLVIHGDSCAIVPFEVSGSAHEFDPR